MGSNPTLSAKTCFAREKSEEWKEKSEEYKNSSNFWKEEKPIEIKNFIKKYIAIFVIAVIAITVISIIVKYNVEGETNPPFQISKIMVISTLGANEKENSYSKWNLELEQINDIYIDIAKNKNYSKEEIIDKVIINDLKIEKAPTKGEINIYRLNNENGIFNNEEEYKIENELIYTGEETKDLENMQIANQGGLIQLRYVNDKIGEYISNEETEIKYDGTLLKKAGIANEEIKFTISFDISIELKSERKYKTNIELEMPIGNLVRRRNNN